MNINNISSEYLMAITSICAVLISIISMIFTIIFSVLQTKHNINSVRPISSIIINDYKDKIAVRIDNVGTGPLTVKKLVIKKDNEQFPTLISMLPKVDSSKLHYPDNVEGRTIPVGGSITLLEINPKCDADRQTIKKELAKTTILIDYTDIYNKKFHDKRLLNFFGRHIDQ